jgi:hypothetical protein
LSSAVNIVVSINVGTGTGTCVIIIVSIYRITVNCRGAGCCTVAISSTITINGANTVRSAVSVNQGFTIVSSLIYQCLSWYVAKQHNKKRYCSDLFVEHFFSLFFSFDHNIGNTQIYGHYYVIIYDRMSLQRFAR